MRKYFGTDGIRGKFGHDPMTVEFARAVGRAAGAFMGKGSVFVIGRDTRSSGCVLSKALEQGISESGASTKSIGVVPTAAVAAHVLREKADVGVMISASHNPAEDNGIKFFSSQGMKLTDEDEERIESLIRGDSSSHITADDENQDFSADSHARDSYFEILRNAMGRVRLDGLKITVDAAHGSAWSTTPTFLSELGAELRVVGASPDGTNINAGCGSTHPDFLKRERAKFEGSIGLAHDGDADRALLIDEAGHELDGDDLLCICGLEMIEKGQLKNNTLIATIMSNMGLDEAIHRAGGSVVRAPVGDRYVLDAMLESGSNLGGEQSGHMIFWDSFPTGDGLLTALHIFKIMADKKMPLCELRRCMTKYPQKLYNIPVREKRPIEEMPEVLLAMNQIESELAQTGRINLRYSGTEKKIRLLLESKDGNNLDPMAERILRPLTEAIGA